MSSFFTVPASQKKRKRAADSADLPKKRPATEKKPSRLPKPTPRPRRDESISGSDSEDDEGGRDREEEDADILTSGSEDEEGGSEEETAAERRLKLAERYLENIRQEVDEVGFDAEEIDRDLIAERLREDAAESKGKIYRNLADELLFQEASHTMFRADTEAVTGIDTCMPFVYTVSKDMKLMKWRIQDLPAKQFLPKGKKKPKKAPPPPRRRPELVAYTRGDTRMAKDNSYQGHVAGILAVAASHDGKYVVTGGRDRRIIIWDASDLKPLRVFLQHRDQVTSLSFRKNTLTLFSGSKDRTIKVFSLDGGVFAYVETLFGHQEEIVDLVGTAAERVISAGARDRTARLWKVAEESQLVFRGGSGEKKSKGTNATRRYPEQSIECVEMIDEDMFITGSDNGALSLYATHKKKAIFQLALAHGLNPIPKLEDISPEEHPNPRVLPEPQPRWITALATIPYSDVIFSGSWDGHVRVWKVSADRRKIEPVGLLGQHTHRIVNGELEETRRNGVDVSEFQDPPLLRGVINGISVFERGERGKEGVCVVVAVGKQHRLGNWLKVDGRNGAVVFEIPRLEHKPHVNGVKTAEKNVDED